MADQSGVAAFLALVFWSVSIFLLRSILSDLLKMHKSKSTVKKIKKQYTFPQKLCLRHVADHTEHAVSFTHFMIKVHHVSFWTMLACMLSRLLLSDRWFVYMLAGRFCIIDLPVMILDSLLERYPFNKRKRRSDFKNRRTFSQYHNTTDKTSLF